MKRPTTYRLSRTRRLLTLPLTEAAKAKWDIGAARMGPEWHGEHPLVEASEELMDAFNYLLVCYAEWYGVGEREMRPVKALVEGLYEWVQVRAIKDGLISLADVVEEDETTASSEGS